jgi:glutamate formiminotransferase/formiminotetrahydrofolate cyclodeaminase
VAAAAGALGAALSAMVARLTLGKQKYRDVSDLMSSILESSEEKRGVLTRRIDEDAAAFDAVMAARRLPKGTEKEQQARALAIATANRVATEMPLATMRDADAVLDLALRAAESGNPNSVSDAGVAALMARAAVEGAWLNVRINLPGLEDEQFRQIVHVEGAALARAAVDKCDRVMALVNGKIDG